MHIHDPATSNTAAVSSDNKLQTYAVGVPEASWISEAAGGSFAVYTKHVIQSADTNEGLGFLQVPSNSQKEIKIQRVVLSHRLGSAGYVHFEMHVDPGTVTTEGVSFEPINMNRGSNKGSVADAWHNGDNSMVVTPADDSGEMLGLSINLYQPCIVLPYNGELVLRPGNTLYISCKSDVTTTNIRGVIYYYEHSIETTT